MNRSKGYALMFLLGAFIAGGALGFSADRAMRGGHGRERRHDPLPPRPGDPRLRHVRSRGGASVLPTSAAGAACSVASTVMPV